ncbi:MAG: iron-containing alcohol dehydrogenase [Clostridia bacterium]|nr:iron-containing alcohol dehydrogenase [Clostridia bacterium]
MPIYEESFRIGCGRYLQGKDYILKTGDEILRYGTSPLIIGGKTALSVAGEKLENSIKEKCNLYEIVTHTGTCNDERAKELAQLANKKGYDVIVGVGGGVICDFAKMCAYFAKLPIINIPTSSATCASFTPLSVRYTPDGKTVGTKHFEYEVNEVIVDTKIIASQPPRLFLAGVFDALAKFIEIKHRYKEGGSGYPTGLDYAYAMSKYSFDLLTEKTKKCLDDMEQNNITEDVENLMFTTISATGVISGIARGSNQTALAHKFYETARYFFPVETKPYIHGEMVGIGLLLQNHYNGEQQNNELLLTLMKKYNMPYRVTDIGVSENAFDDFYNKICNSSAIDNNDKAQCEKFRNSLQYLWDLR